jgi:hypothetical protein
VTPVKVTTAVDQTLTCKIRDQTAAVAVTWKDSYKKEITSGQSGYTIVQGSVDPSTKIQESTLTISFDTLKRLGAGAVTFKCAAKSTQYPISEISDDQIIVVDTSTFGKSPIIKRCSCFMF